MKASGASAAGLVLATGVFSKADLWAFEFAVPTLPTLYITSFDVPLTVGGNTYLTDLLISRGSVDQRAGVEAQSLDLEISQHTDGAPVMVAGLPFLQAVRLGYFDSCRVTYSKLFMATPGDVSAGAVPWFQGRVSDVDGGQSKVQVTVESDLALLNIAMPRNVIQAGCTHRVFDAGCTLNPATWRVAGAVTAVASDRTYVDSGLTQADDYFALGVLTFTSGALNGVGRTVKSSTNSSGRVTFMQPLPVAPAVGDTFTVLPGCDKKQATCSGKFSNLAHFRGYPYVPTPETIYAGGITTRDSTGGGSYVGRQRDGWGTSIGSKR